MKNNEIIYLKNYKSFPEARIFINILTPPLDKIGFIS